MNYGFYPTSIGFTKIAQAVHDEVKLDITHVAVGSGGDPNADIDFNITSLVDEKYRKPMLEGDSYEIDEINRNFIKILTTIPDDAGEFRITEVGYFDSDGDLVIYGLIQPVEKEQGVGSNLRVVELENYIGFTAEQIEAINLVVRSQEQEAFRQEILKLVENSNCKCDRISESEIYEICFGDTDYDPDDFFKKEELPIDDVVNLLDGNPYNDPDYSKDNKEFSLSTSEIENLTDGNPDNDPTWEADDESMPLDEVAFILET